MLFFTILSACGEVKVSVVREPPSVIITEPSEGSTFMVGENVLFGATAKSSSDDPADMIHVWVSSNEEVCVASPVPADGKPTCVIQFLQAGEQTVTITVTDSQNDTSTASVSVNIVENLAPSISIISPNDLEMFTPDELIVIQAEVSDPEDAAHLLTMSVESSIDGVLPYQPHRGPMGSSMTAPTSRRALIS